MRSIFVETLIELAKKDERIILLTADLGYTVLESFRDQFPKRFFNVGVAEQNMVGMATGLASDGFIPFVYSIANFASLRPYEFIRNGPIHHQLPVRIVAVGGGFDYGPAGITHYGLEDVGVMRLQKGMMVVVPTDTAQAKTALEKTWEHQGPVYYRVGKGDKAPLANLNGQFDLGRAHLIGEGKDLLFIVMGSLSKEVIAASELLMKKKISSSIVVVSHFNPSPEKDMINALKKFPLAITVEDHYVTGGLGSFVAEVIADHQIPCRLIRCGIEGQIKEKVGSKNFMNDQYGISSQKLVEVATQSLEKFIHAKSSILDHTSRL